MQRLAIGVEYEGTRYHGWQKQIDYPSIQQEIESALEKIANHPVAITVAGRTDAGVHACNQVIHCDVAIDRKDYQWVFGANRHLPADIRLLWAKPVSADFDARHSAIYRRYTYIIYNHKIRPGLLRNLVSWYFGPLDAAAMHAAAQYWLGKHDFSSFRDSDCQSKTPIREVLSFDVERLGNFIRINVCANAFLHHMVRNFVGLLVKIGRGRAPIEHAKEVLLARNRCKADNTAPANGLYLLEVGYPVEFDLPHAQLEDVLGFMVS